MSAHSFAGRKGDFPATRPSIIDGLRHKENAEHHRAFCRFCDLYWVPIYKYVRIRWGRSPADAEDLTQGFFVKTVERDLLKRFDGERSRFRTYVRLCVDSFVINEKKGDLRQKRGGLLRQYSIDCDEAEQEIAVGTTKAETIASTDSLEEFFEKEWLRNLFALAINDLRLFCVQRDRARTFQLFELYDLNGDDKISYAQLAQQFEIALTDVTNHLAWARREFRRFALCRLREICKSDAEFQREAHAVFGQDERMLPGRQFHTTRSGLF